jgi:ABC-type transport system substrate-binding protein
VPRPVARAARSLLAGLGAVALAAALAACGGSDDAPSAAPTTAAPTTTAPTTSEPTASAPTTTAAATAPEDPGEATDPAALPSCEEILQQYTDAFTPDDLAPVVALFRRWAPAMPDDVGAAVRRIADAYDEAGDLGGLDLGDVDLSEDATTFSDWTADGCPAR